jgi:hypothetical protein
MTMAKRTPWNVKANFGYCVLLITRVLGEVRRNPISRDSVDEESELRLLSTSVHRGIKNNQGSSL